MLRAVLVSGAVEQEEEWIMYQGETGVDDNHPFGAGRRRYVVLDHEADAQRTSESSLV